MYLPIQLACPLLRLHLPLSSLVMMHSASKRETSLTCVSAFTGLNCRLASLQPACLLARSLLLAGLHTHLFGCICRYSSLALSLLLHLPLSSLLMMHSAKENRHLRGLCFSFRRLELSACQPHPSCQPSGCLPAYLLTCLLAVSANTDCVHIIYYHSLLIFDFTVSW